MNYEAEQADFDPPLAHGAPANTQGTELFTETPLFLFPSNFLHPFGNRFRPSFGNSLAFVGCSTEPLFTALGKCGGSFGRVPPAQTLGA
jgi:hypothetical protein